MTNQLFVSGGLFLPCTSVHNLEVLLMQPVLPCKPDEKAGGTALAVKRGRSVSSKHDLVKLIQRLVGVKPCKVGVQLMCTFFGHLTLMVVWIR